MSAYPSVPGFKSNASTSAPSSLPARPPPPAGGPPRGFKPAFPPTSTSTQSSNYGSTGSSGFTGFAPRAVASNQPPRAMNSYISAGPQPNPSYGAQPTYGTGYQQSYPAQPYYEQGYQNDYAGSAAPQIRNPFAPATGGPIVGPSAGAYGGQVGTDPDTEAAIAQWQSAYASKDDSKTPKVAGLGTSTTATGANSASIGGRQETDQKGGEVPKPKTVQRAGGGQTWNDNTLLEWDPAHFRLFVGNLAGEVTDDSLLKAFAKYTSVQKARVIRDKRTTKSKGFGFISFSDGDDYFKAARDMQGKYIGSHPVLIKKSTTEIKPVTQRDPRQQNRKGGKSGNNKQQQQQQGNGVLSAHTGAGVGKRPAKTKGGLRILG